MNLRFGIKAVAAAFAAACALAAPAALAQEDFVPEGETYVIRDPAAWSRLRGEYAVTMGFEPWLVRGEVGVFDYLSVGVSYGGVGVLGAGDPAMNPRPGFQAKLRITNGTAIIPAIAVGYDDQGYGVYYDMAPFDPTLDYDRYRYKAKGFYGVVSQEIEFLGALGLHAGVSYNLTETKDDKGLTGWGALEKSIGPHFMALATYDLDLNDNAEDSLGQGRGYLDAGVRWRLSDKFNVEFVFADVLQDQHRALGDAGKYSRVLYLTYIDSF